jgi:hypothetical protein
MSPNVFLNVIKPLNLIHKQSTIHVNNFRESGDARLTMKHIIKSKD